MSSSGPANKEKCEDAAGDRDQERGDHKMIVRAKARRGEYLKTGKSCKVVHSRKSHTDMGISEEEVRSILKLTGEMPDEEISRTKTLTCEQIFNYNSVKRWYTTRLYQRGFDMLN